MRPVAIQLISTGGFYGAEKALLELAVYLSEKGWESHVIALEGKGAPELLRQARSYGIHAEALADDSLPATFALASALRCTLRRYPRAIVHSHGYKPDILLAGLRIPRRLCCIATCHSWYSDTAKMRLTEWLDKRLLRRFHHVVAVSDEIRTDLLCSGLEPSHVSRIDNGIAAPPVGVDDRIRVRAEMGVAPDEFLLVQIGRLAKSKRNDLLLEAVARTSPELRIHVLLVGEGDQYPSLVEKTASLGLAGRVSFCGYRSDVPRILAGADLLALTSDKEGLPIVVLEAMALGCPIVSTAVGAIPTVLTDKESGWVVPLNDVDALHKAIDESLSNRRLAVERAVRAKEKFRTSLSRDVMGQKYLAIYDRIWRERGWV